ncbi:MAG TPA: hypothetical protein VL172_08700 [Kofleriaceae bacterium]|nr:hypothetical protein [Kofleriaceae bacterium]
MKWLCALLLLAGCPASLEEEAEHALGPEVGDEGPTHRPGQPCLVCHSAQHDPGEEEFVLAGTVYERAADTSGMADIEVRMTDADGRAFSALSNQAGNFMVRVDTDVADPTQDDDGRVRIPFAPTFPVTVEVRRGALTKEMRNIIGREGSCAACHTDPADARSNGRVFLVDP